MEIADTESEVIDISSEVVGRALQLSEFAKVSPKAIERVATEVGEDLARWAFTQWELRKRAKTKFERAHEMLFDREGLEMASHEAVAAYHASQFMQGETVADLTCGIGSDLIALARRGPAIGYETDADRVDIARFNLSAHGLDAQVVNADSLPRGGGLGRGYKNDVIAYDTAFADPARRGGGRRFVSQDEFSPNPVLIAEKMRNMRLGGIKLSPMLPDEFLESLGGRLEFVSYGRECREALVWLGRESGGGRWAVHVESGERLRTLPPPNSVHDPLEYIYDCDPAAVRAHAIGTLCINLHLQPVGDSNGYLTSKNRTVSVWLRSYRVVWHGKADTKTTVVELKKRGAKIVEVKTRGVKEPANQIRSRFKSSGKTPLILLVWPVGKSLRHALIEAK